MPIWKKELKRHPWTSLRAASGPSDPLATALEKMLSARTPRDVENAYWCLENHAVVQGQLYEVAPHVVSVLMSALLEDSPVCVRIGILELLFQILSGEAHASEPVQSLGEQCRSLAREGMWLLYGELEADLAGHRAAALDVVKILELDPSKLAYFASI